EREFVALEFLPITHRQFEDIVIEFERGVEVADADGDVVKISGFEIHSAVAIRPVKNHQSRKPPQLASQPSDPLADSLTNTAATVSSTSWTRTMSAPRSAATALAATVAEGRSFESLTRSNIDLWEWPIKTGQPSAPNSSVRPSMSKPSRGCFPNPSPGSTMIF